MMSTPLGKADMALCRTKSEKDPMADMNPGRIARHLVQLPDTRVRLQHSPIHSPS